MSTWDVNNLNFNIADSKYEGNEAFMLEEYKNLSEAHYNTTESISNFFKHYLLIVSVPITLLSLSEKFLDKGKGLQVFPIGIVCLLISLVGFFVCAYVINLRCDAILYARAVNGLRNYFIEKAKIPYYNDRLYRVLPRNKELPAYLEHTYFLAVVIVFAIINSFALYLSMTFFYQYSPISWLYYAQFISPVVFLFLHYVIYLSIAYHRENDYLRSRIIGIDIDGVLNKHREHFCKFLEKEVNITIKPENIKKIPVHECSQLALTNQNEKAVFHSVDYWKKMPVADGASDYVKKIRNMLQYKIYIFTARPWPDFPSLDHNVSLKYKKQWKGVKIGKLTKKWLKKKKIPVDKFILEANTASEVRTGIKNRFTLCKSKKIDIFVEDQVENALRLCPMCRVVFLIKHPYNEEAIIKNFLPSNIIPVDNWKDIYHFMRNIL